MGSGGYWANFTSRLKLLEHNQTTGKQVLCSDASCFPMWEFWQLGQRYLSDCFVHNVTFGGAGIILKTSTGLAVSIDCKRVLDSNLPVWHYVLCVCVCVVVVCLSCAPFFPLWQGTLYYLYLFTSLPSSCPMLDSLMPPINKKNNGKAYLQVQMHEAKYSSLKSTTISTLHNFCI